MDDDRPVTGFDPPIGDHIRATDDDDDVGYVTEWNWPFIGGAVAIVVVLGAVVAFMTLREGDPPPSTTTTTAAPTTTQVSAVSTIAQLLPLDTQFAALVELVADTEVLEQLGSAGEVTLFAPTSDALTDAEGLPEPGSEAAQEVVRGHIVEGSLDLEALRELDGSSVTTLAGEQLPVAVAEDGSVSVGGATITKSAIVASNGVIFVVDSLVNT